ncbi:phage tail tape measure protein [Acutalibacter sp. 1XD8-36]|uniref:phage tail tape measure protein n=1 Tax=Acutalibacter sp. 1XD8-36 TaxID=2320852 RepID=UPI00141241DA|nr:phage tail tape measure protein [Acutalibacter sp. 1XD8-36]NBJ87932.1 phage tail tape measure protein [Acutalibacter sp. 1XD8-36]
MAGPSQVTIKIAAKLEKDFGSAISAAQKAVSGLKGLGGMAATGAKVAAGSLAAVGGALATAGVASVNTGREFEAAMSSAAATANATEAEYKKLEAAAMEMGRTTSKTATESANALEYMSLAGWDVDTSISALPSVLKMSEASGMDLAHCSDLITDSMSAAGVSVDNLAGYLDIATKAQNKSNQTAEHMMEAFIGVGGTMKGLNIPIEDTATALGVLANRGIKGSEAGNALNAIMANLTTGTGAAGKMMESLGISAFDSEGKFIGLEATLQKVNQATAGLSEEQRNAALAAIGGKQHIDALNDLMSGLNTTTADGVSEWEALSQQLYNADGALETMRATKLDNLNGDLATLQSALEDTGIRVYQNLQEPLRGAAQFATEQIYTLSDALNNGGFEGMASAVGNVLSNAFTKVVDFAPQFIMMASVIATSLLNGLVQNGPVLAQGLSQLVVQGLGAFAGFYSEFWSTGAALLAQFLQGMAGEIPNVIAIGSQTMQSLGAGITANLPTILSAGTDIIVQLIGGIGVLLPQLLSMGGQILGQLVQGILTAIPQIAAAAFTLMSDFGSQLQANLPTVIQQGVQMVVDLVASICANAGMLIDGALALINGLVSGLMQGLPAIISAVPSIISSLANGIISNIPTILQAGVQLIVTLAQGLLQAIPSLLAAIPQIAWSIITALTSVNWLQVGWDIFMTLVDGVLSIDWLQLGMDILNAIKDGILSAVGGLFESVGNIWNNVTSFFTGKGKETGDSTAAAIQSTTPAVQEAASGVGRSAVTGMQNSLSTSLPSMTASANAAGAALTSGINSGVASGAGQLDSTVASMGTSATASLNGSINQGLASVNTSAVASGTAYTDGMTAGLQSGMPGVQSAAQTGCDAVVQQTTSSFERVRSAVETKMNAAATAVTNAIGKMRAAMNFSWSLPHLKVPHVNISGAFSLQPPTAPNFSVSWYKEGGILSGAQIFGMQGNRLLGGGEAGKEAVLPLSTLWQQMRGMFAESAGGVRERINALGQQLGLAENSRRLSFSGLLDGVKGGPQPATAGGPPMQITYAPQYYFQGEAPTKDDLEGAEEMSQSKFNEMMNKWMKDHSRKDF